MAGPSGNRAEASFVGELHRALQHLYDPGELRHSPLLEAFGVDRQERPVSSLRRILIGAIGALKPSPQTPLQSSDSRIYRALFNRYVEQFTQREVASSLALSIRQLRRQENEAVQVLADYLWAHYHLQQRTQGKSVAAQADNAAGTPGAGAGREQELEWLRRSFPNEPTDAAELIQAVLSTVGTLLQAAQVRMSCRVPDGLPRLAVQPDALREALLNIVTAAIRSAPQSQVSIGAEVLGQQVCITIEPARAQSATPSVAQVDAESLEMARQLVGVCGGALELTLGERGQRPFIARLILPAAERVAVLLIDDNADAQRLFHRYLQGTRYPLIGARDPEQALALAVDAPPRIIVLDIMLPGVDGWQLLGRLREHPRLAGVPIAVCSILPQEQLALALGAAAFLRKPVTRSALLSMLDSLVGSRATGS